MERSFASDFHSRTGEVSADELEAARDLVRTKYATAEWINRLP
jgi:hypothetical protein